MELSESYLRASNKLADAEAEYKSEVLKMRDVLIDELKSIISKNSELASISWQQFTPSFADGDVPEFTCHGIYGDIDLNYCGNDNIPNNGFPKTFTQEQKDQFRKLQKEVHTILCKLKQEDYQIMFGDPVEVTVTINGYTKEYCCNVN